MESLHKKLFVELLEKKINSNDDIKYDSFFNIIEEYLNLEKDIENANEKTAELLRRSRKDYISNLHNLINTSPFFLFSNRYKNDLRTIHKSLAEKEIDFYLLKTILTAFLKKRKIDYFNNVQFILDNNRIDFKYIITLVDNVLMEFKFHNISFEKIKSILKHTDNKSQICLKIQAYFERSSEKQFPICFLKIEIPGELREKDKIYIQDHALYKVFDESWQTVNNGFIKEYEEDIIDFFITQNNKEKYGKSKGSLYLFDTKYLDGTDYRTKVRNMAEYIEKELNWINHRENGRKKRLVHNIAFTSMKDDFKIYKNFNITLAAPRTINIHYKRQQLNIEEFYRNYIIALHNSKNEIDSFKVIYNLLNLIENTDDMTLENQLVILWSSLEKICVDLNENSIISKVTTISSKAHLMYVLKQDLNNIWHLITQNNLHETMESIKGAIIEPSGEEKYVKYNPEELLSILKSMSEEDQKFIMEKDITLGAYIYCFVNRVSSTDNIKQYLKEEEEIVNQHIRRIYRHRNILTHANMNKTFDIHYFVKKLRGYLYSLISILIHYTLRNPELNIKDIIYSIDKTYEFYIKDIISKDDYREMLKPHYLYL